MALTKVTSGGISDIAAAVEGASDSNKFTDADHTKLNAIEASATADQTNAEIKAAVEAATDSNTFTDADHTKLNAIEASATADQTDAEIRAAVEAASDSNVFTDADHTKLNGVAASANNYVHPNHSGDVVSAADGAMTIQTDAVDIAMLSATGTPGSTTFLRGDNSWATAGSTSASDLTSGTLPDARFPATLPAISGANLTGISSVGGATGVDFNDNVKARFGTGNDLEIYHDGSNSYIDDTGTGDLRIKGANDLIIQSSTGENMIKCVKDAQVNLYYDNVKKFNTTADGVTASGTTLMTGSGQTGNPASSGSTQVNTVAEFSGAGNQRLYVGTDTSSNRMWFQNANPGALNVPYDISFQPVGGFVKIANFSATGASAGADFNGEGKLVISANTSSSKNLIGFYNTNINVGNIITSGSSTSYSTSSDYRLKENVDYTWDATTRLKQLKPARFNFIADDTNTFVDGFLAHEVSSIVPEAVSGEKDAMTTQVLYVEGDVLPEGKSVGDVKEASVPDMQGIDQSKLVPLLVKAMQEQQTTIEALTARITALEG